jgi:hypothetical protein
MVEAGQETPGALGLRLLCDGKLIVTLPELRGHA